MWSPVVSTPTPASYSSPAVFWVIPIPPAAFSPLAITRSGEWRSRNCDIARASPARPGFPTTSPMNRTRIGGAYPPHTRAHTAGRDARVAAADSYQGGTDAEHLDPLRYPRRRAGARAGRTAG